MKRLTRLTCLFALVIIVLAAVPLLAQETTSSIQGTITDATGAVLPGVTVEASNQKGQKYSTTSDNGGHYRFASVSPGTYAVSATMSGMEGTGVKNLQVVLGASPRVDFKLKPGAVTESMTVTAEAPVVDVTQSAKATSIRSEQFERLPKGRDFTTIVTEAAGANNETRVGGISVDGATGLENVYVVDGVNTTEPRLGTSGKRIITDEIDEVQVKSSGYEAEFGGATGGVINVITKTGTNNFSGSVSSYYRDSSLDGASRKTLQRNSTDTAPEYVTYKKDSTRIVEPGATLGGPIMADRLWFFGSYQPSLTNTDRTVTFTNPGTFPATNTFTEKVNEKNFLGNLNGNLGAKALFKIAGNQTGSTDKNPSLPPRSGRAAADPSLYRGIEHIGDNTTFSGYVDVIPTSSIYLSARGGQYATKYRETGIPNTPQVNFYRGSNKIFPETPANLVRDPGYLSVPTNSAVTRDNYTRDNFSLEGSYFANLAGSHSFKVGFQNENVKNDVLSGNQAPQYRFQWGRNDRFFASQGKYGAVGVMVFQTTGNVVSKNNAFFAQDSWNMLKNRLTINYGLRAESEKIPQYSNDPTLPQFAIDWGYGDKLAPRFGFSYDVSGNGRSKIYGSYGKFYDRMKLALARGSWGGDKWLWHAFTLDTVDWTAFNCTGVSNDKGTHPTCTGGSYIGTIDLRAPSLDAIDPGIKPMESQEFTLGGQQEIGRNMSFGIRYVHKNLLRAIEDMGTLLETSPGQFEESYTIGNPGFGLSAVGSPDIPGLPKATRRYDGLEFELTKRFTSRFGYHVTYLYSRTYGNYAGLANPDEQGTDFSTPRIEPNVSRWGDFVETVYDASGSKKSPEGRLPSDRPHQLKAQLSYQAPFGTNFGLNQYAASGTPVSTIMYVHAAEFYPFGRGNLGRTPWYKQTDLLISHRIPLSRYGLELSVNVLNLFDSKTPVAIWEAASQDSVKEGGASFFKGFDAKAELATMTPDALYGQATTFQSPREVRFQVRFTF